MYINTMTPFADESIELFL